MPTRCCPVADRSARRRHDVGSQGRQAGIDEHADAHQALEFPVGVGVGRAHRHDLHDLATNHVAPRQRRIRFVQARRSQDRRRPPPPAAGRIVVNRPVPPAARCSSRRRARSTDRCAASLAATHATEEVDAHHLGDVRRLRLLQQIQMAPGLDDASSLHHHDLVAEDERVLVLVRHHHGRQIVVREDLSELALDFPRVWMSRAESDSSRSSRRGLSASARAMATRCCCPPDSCPGCRSS